MHLSRRSVVEGSIAAVGLGSASPLPAMAAPGPFVPYTPGSFFRSRVERAPVDHARTRSFRRRAPRPICLAISERAAA